jgi:hypothetical protein
VPDTDINSAMTALQAALVSALAADPAVASAIGSDGILDAPPQGRHPPYLAISRHDALNRDADLAPGADHRMSLTIWVPRASRATALAIAADVTRVALFALGDPAGWRITHRHHERTDSEIEPRRGWTRATLRLRFFTEPA